MTFPSTHPALARALAARGYVVPTAVQVAIPTDSAANRDLLVSAQTGSGKTVAFGLAIAATLLGPDERFAQAAEPLALIIAPTRELAMQVQRELAWLYAETGARVITCVGGMDVRAEAPAARVRRAHRGRHARPPARPPGAASGSTSASQSVVLDEADEMLDLGFREDLEFILDATPQARQTLLFSATMPREIETLAGRYQRRRGPHRDGAAGRAACRYRISRHPRRAARHRACGRQRAAPARDARSARLLRHARSREAAACAARGARLFRRGPVGRADPERAHASAAGAARRPRPRPRRDGRGGARARPARSRPRHPCRSAERSRDAAAPLGPHRPGRQARACAC